MNWNEQFINAANRIQLNPADLQAASEISYQYWNSILDTVGNLIREKGDLEAFLDAESSLLNYGLCKDVLPTCQEMLTTITANNCNESQLKVITITEWLRELVTKITQGDRKDVIEKEVQVAKIQIRKLHSEVETVQSERKQRLYKFLIETTASPSKLYKKQIDTLEQTDQLLLESIKAKRTIAKGVFLTVDQKREHFAREQQLQKELIRLTSLIDMIQDKEVAIETKKLNSQVEATFTKILELEDVIAKLSEEMIEIERKQQDISLLEIENRIRREIEYLRDLTKLSAKRLHMESCPLVRSGEKPFTYAILNDCIDRIAEFDPLLFKNDRVSIFGRPQVLIVPGSGNTLYDWKNNRLLVPLIAPGANFMASVAAGIIEYRLDVDEDKKLLTSFNQIPELKTMRSIVQLRLRLVKDYITFMTSEYKGYRLLAKDIKDWFEHEIAPNKNEIFTPLDYQQFSISSGDYKKLLSEKEAILSTEMSAVKSNDLWVGSILYYQQGKFDRSFELLNEFLKREPDNLMALYNCGQVGMKCMIKQQAIDCFTKYCNLNPQSWWARIAREHLRRLSV